MSGNAKNDVAVTKKSVTGPWDRSGENSVPFRELSVREPVHPHVRDFDLQ